ncbi:Ubiquitin-conjugating enzyme E2-binding protein [Parasponia andersonii]|uniref:Ubiquitin-conjugating enzyme E2-binding protein n=1 Tax=Parasponia andersonii TaxID=3476 RepID=A0A2P5DR16_PARAD|nr:Ubiquitin-conjugating enzyme E2-binding protein [Parasponia andersonii]
MSRELRDIEYPRKWRFTWEAQSHIPTLRLFLFNSHSKPSLQCRSLQVHVSLPQSVVLITWFDHDDYKEGEVSLRVPIPRVLIDDESPVSFRAMDDHIEVKLALLLPVGHPIVSSSDSILKSSGDEQNRNSDESMTLSVDSDIRSLSSSEGLHFYCRNCEFNLTRSPLRKFAEMPSVNWREVADNWFGACCCSFGGISEQMVTRFANSYSCSKGTCLVNFGTLVVCKDDLVEYNFPDCGGDECHEAESDLTVDLGFGESTLTLGTNYVCDEKSGLTKSKDEEFDVNGMCEITDEGSSNHDRLSHLCLESDSSGNEELEQGCCTHHVSGTSLEDQKLIQSTEILENQKSFLNGYLGNIFMVKSSNLSKDVEWVEFFCPQCSSLLGAYPCANGCAPLDGGVRLFKCYILTSLAAVGSKDFFRKYTLERMFTTQLLDCAKDELSFRTVVIDLKTRVPMLQIVLVNSNSWSCTGYCLSTQSCLEPVQKLDLQPVIKVLFSECSNNTESEIRAMEDQIKKDLADEVFMPRSQIVDIVESLVLAKNALPPSCSSFQGLSLSSLQM